MDLAQSRSLWESCEGIRLQALSEGRQWDEADALASDHWNEWAQQLINRRKAIESANQWMLYGLRPLSKQTREWCEEAKVVLSCPDKPWTIDEDIRCGGWIFPGRLICSNAIMKGRADFAGAHFGLGFDFTETQFFSAADFRDVFGGDAVTLNGAIFSKEAIFRGARFRGSLAFENVSAAEVNFEEAQCLAPASLRNLIVEGIANFRGAAFAENAIFDNSIFQGPAQFNEVHFKSMVTFNHATFKLGDVSFQAVNAEARFSLANATFKFVPDFTQARFNEAPRLDNALFPSTLACITDDTLGSASSRDLPARFRALKRLATLGHDTERELEFGAAEIISRRRTYDRPFSHNTDRYWLGRLYETLSDFGRSIWTPFFWWVFVVTAFAIFYVSPLSGRQAPPQTRGVVNTVSVITAWALNCEEVPNSYSYGAKATLDTVAIYEAFSLSLQNAMVIVSPAIPTSDWRTLGCLYGSSADSPSHREVPPQVSAASSIQRCVSIVLISLFILALRNVLRLK